MKKRIFTVCVSLLIPVFFLISNPVLLTPERKIKLLDYPPYGSLMFFLPEKSFFVFGKKKGFIVIDSKGKIIKKYFTPFQSPGSLIGLFNFFKSGKKYYAVGMNKVVILNEGFEFVDSISQCSVCGGGVCWVNEDKSFLCLSSYSGVEWRDSKGGLIKRNKKLVNRIDDNKLSYYFNYYLTFIKYPLLYVLNAGNLKLFVVDMKTLNLVETRNLKIPEKFRSAFVYDREVNIGMDIKKYFKVSAGYGNAIAFKVEDNYIAVCWVIARTEKRYLTLYSKDGKIEHQFQLEKTMETTYPRAVFHPTKPILYDYDYIESEDGNDYGLIRVYDLGKAIKGEKK